MDIYYEGRLAAVIRGDRAHLHPDVEFGNGRVARFVFAMAACVLHPDGRPIDEGDAQSEAEFVARWLLMPNAAYGPLAHLPDERLAEIFDVPPAEVARKRDDLARTAAN